MGIKFANTNDAALKRLTELKAKPVVKRLESIPDLDAELAAYEAEKEARALSAPAQTVRMKGKRKQMVNLRLEPDLLEWFRATGPGYQARMAEALEEYRRRALQK